MWSAVQGSQTSPKPKWPRPAPLVSATTLESPGVPIRNPVSPVSPSGTGLREGFLSTLCPSRPSGSACTGNTARLPCSASPTTFINKLRLRVRRAKRSPTSRCVRAWTRFSRSHCNTITNHSAGGRYAICLTIKFAAVWLFSKQTAAPIGLEVSGCNPSVTFDNKSSVRRQLATYCHRNSFKLPFGISLLGPLRLKER